MKHQLAALLMACFAMSCGDDDPVSSAGRPVLKENFTINGGTFRSFSFQIDIAIERNASIQGEFSAQGGEVSFAILSESNFQRWQEGHAPATLYSPGTMSQHAFSGIPIFESGTYYFVFVNVQAATPVTVSADLSLVAFAEQEL